MIINFTINNYKSFRKSANLTLEAENFERQKDITVRALSDRNILPVVGIFGPNAGGKTNILKGLDFFTQAIKGYDRLGNQLKTVTNHSLLSNFKLDDNKEPVEFEIEILSKNQKREFLYGFSIQDRVVLYEKFQITERAKKNRTQRVIFSRKLDKIEYSDHIRDSLKGLEDVIAYGEDMLTITRLANIIKLPIAVEFLKEIDLIFVSPNNGRTDIDRLYSDSSLQEKVISFIRDTDTNIMSISVDRPEIPKKIKERLSNDQSVPDNIRRAVVENKLYSISSIHRGYGIGKGPVRLDFHAEESKGTNRLLSIAIPMIRALESGGILALDEVDTSLHPFLSAKIVETFQDPKTNPNHAQLIFTSHEEYLMSKAVGLRTDQIYIAEKDAKEQSTLVSLAEFNNPRNDAALDRQYMDARFGGVPILTHGGFNVNG